MALWLAQPFDIHLAVLTGFSYSFELFEGNFSVAGSCKDSAWVMEERETNIHREVYAVDRESGPAPGDLSMAVRMRMSIVIVIRPCVVPEREHLLFRPTSHECEDHTCTEREREREREREEREWSALMFVLDLSFGHNQQSRSSGVVLLNPLLATRGNLLSFVYPHERVS